MVYFLEQTTSRDANTRKNDQELQWSKKTQNFEKKVTLTLILKFKVIILLLILKKSYNSTPTIDNTINTSTLTLLFKVKV